MATFSVSLLCYKNDAAQCAMGEISCFVSIVFPTTLLDVNMTHGSSDIMSCNYTNIVFVSLGIVLAVIGMIVGISGFLLGLQSIK